MLTVLTVWGFPLPISTNLSMNRGHNNSIYWTGQLLLYNIGGARWTLSIVFILPSTFTARVMAQFWPYYFRVIGYIFLTFYKYRIMHLRTVFKQTYWWRCMLCYIKYCFNLVLRLLLLHTSSPINAIGATILVEIWPPLDNVFTLVILPPVPSEIYIFTFKCIIEYLPLNHIYTKQ